MTVGPRHAACTRARHGVDRNAIFQSTVVQSTIVQSTSDA